mmetsp:Transcript_9830/g.29722  ORF Transcript_9830/g.29722 Transcript_9830/m.29722 type:complete len:205 (+) Transcript_9830:58-672(+)
MAYVPHTPKLSWTVQCQTAVLFPQPRGLNVCMRHRDSSACGRAPLQHQQLSPSSCLGLELRKFRLPPRQLPQLFLFRLGQRLLLALLFQQSITLPHLLLQLLDVLFQPCCWVLWDDPVSYRCRCACGSVTRRGGCNAGVAGLVTCRAEAFQLICQTVCLLLFPLLLVAFCALALGSLRHALHGQHFFVVHAGAQWHVLTGHDAP